VGEKLVEKLEAQKDVVDSAEVARLAKFKRERCEKAFANKKKAS
jgi:hypothetical protein